MQASNSAGITVITEEMIESSINVAKRNEAKKSIEIGANMAWLDFLLAFIGG